MEDWNLMVQPKNGQLPLQDCRIFIVDDEDILAWSIENEFRAQGAEVMRAGSIRQALERFPGFNADVAISDIRLPDGNGLELVKKWHFERPDMPTILITAHGAIDSAVTALRLGAFDYLQKPFDLKDLLAAVKRAAEVSLLRQKVSRMEGREKTGEPIEIIGKSAPMVRVRDRLRRVAASKTNTVLILGESGSGKELAARAIHEWSGRAQYPFVEINCASIPENLLESELFGYEKGAFTDARERKLGLFEIARNGTIFLDEIGELPMKLQSKLLRALEYRRFKRLGGIKDIDFSARIVAATNRTLTEEIAGGRFRSDLYFRLNVIQVELPPLRDRPEDIGELCQFLTEQVCMELGVPHRPVNAEASKLLTTFRWPGNVRELRNVLQRAIVLFDSPEVEVGQIEVEPLPEVHHRSEPVTSTLIKYAEPITDTLRNEPSSDHGEMKQAFKLPSAGVALDDLEKSLLEQALERTKHNQTKAAQLLHISRHTLRYRLEKYGLMSPETN